jgi:hypothetical protein
LIDVRVCAVSFHEQSVRRNALCCKGSPRYLALSLVKETCVCHGD